MKCTPENQNQGYNLNDYLLIKTASITQDDVGGNILSVTAIATIPAYIMERYFAKERIVASRVIQKARLMAVVASTIDSSNYIEFDGKTYAILENKKLDEGYNQITAEEL
jgi:hypothetical protein